MFSFEAQGQGKNFSHNFHLKLVLDGLSSEIRPTSEIKLIKTRRKAVKQPLFKEDMILQAKCPWESTRILICEFSDIAA